jgi:uncharacterized protein (TIGR00255 family)
MTGYGRSSRQTELGLVTVEMRSTNHRYLELDVRLPNGLSALEERVAALLRGAVRRGRVEATVGVHAPRWSARRIAFDEQLLAQYYAALVQLKGRFGLKGSVTLEQLLGLPQAVTVSEERVPAERLWEAVRRAATDALEELVRARRREGAKLTADLRRQLQAISQHLRAVKRRLPAALAEQRRRLREQLRGLLGGGAAPRLEQAAALVRDVDVHEELVRLESHLGQMRQALASGQPLGKRLDFMGQELMRETNTLGAKVNDAQAAQHVVAMKECIEKIREQVQNLE